MPRHLENRVKITLRTLDGSQHVTCGHSFPFQLPPLCDTGKQNIAPRFEEISIASRFEKYRSLLENLLKVKICPALLPLYHDFISAAIIESTFIKLLYKKYYLEFDNA